MNKGTNRRDFLAALGGAAVAGTMQANSVPVQGMPVSPMGTGRQLSKSQTEMKSYKPPTIEEIFRAFYLGGTAEAAACQLRYAIQRAWKQASSYPVREEFDLMAALLYGKIDRPNVIRIVTPKYVTDLHDLGAKRSEDCTQAKIGAMTVSLSASFPPATYVRPRKDSTPSERLAGVFTDACWGLLEELDDKVAAAKSRAQEVDAWAQKIEYVTYPSVWLQREAYMLEFFVYFHAVVKPAA